MFGEGSPRRATANQRRRPAAGPSNLDLRWRPKGLSVYVRLVPTIYRDGPYRFFFFSNEGLEPAHVHIQRDRSLAKFWLQPVALASSVGFSSRELRRLRDLVAEHRDDLEEAWNEFFRADD